MAGFVPAIQDLLSLYKNVDTRHKGGHDRMLVSMMN
jgi:hypothetical protein